MDLFDQRWHFPGVWDIAGAAVVIAVVGALVAFHFWMIVDAVRRPERDFEPPSSRPWWLIGLIGGVFCGPAALAVSITYFLVVRQRLASRTRTPVAVGAPGAGRPSCAQCGAGVPSGARYCPSCGSALP